MKDVTEFIEKMVTIDYIKEQKGFGHYPFQLFAETQDGKFEMNALCLPGQIQLVYKRINHYIEQQAKRIYVSVDFPKMFDSPSDWVGIIAIETTPQISIECYGLPYNTKTGERMELVKDAFFVKNWKKNVAMFLKQFLVEKLKLN